MAKQIFTFNTVEQVDTTLKNEWKGLWNRAENATIFNSYEWFNAVSKLKKEKIYIFCCYKNKKLVALVPLQKDRCFGVPVYTTLCNERLGDTSFLMETYEPKLFQYFFANIFKKKNVFLQKFDDKAAKLLHKFFPHLLIPLISVNPTITFDGDPFASASQSMINQTKRLMRKNEKTITFKMYDRDLKKHYKTMLKLHDATAKSKKDMNIFSDENNKKYYESLVDNCSQNVRISFLYFNNTPIAYEYGFQYKNIYVGEQIAYHYDYRKLSPGKMMVLHIIEHLKRIHVNNLDMGGGISSYKQAFTKDYRLLYNVYSSPNLAIRVWWGLFNALRRMNQILFPKKNTRDHEFLFKPI